MLLRDDISKKKLSLIQLEFKYFKGKYNSKMRLKILTYYVTMGKTSQKNYTAISQHNQLMKASSIAN